MATLKRWSRGGEKERGADPREGISTSESRAVSPGVTSGRWGAQDRTASSCR